MSSLFVLSLSSLFVQVLVSYLCRCVGFQKLDPTQCWRSGSSQWRTLRMRMLAADSLDQMLKWKNGWWTTCWRLSGNPTTRSTQLSRKEKCLNSKPFNSAVYVKGSTGKSLNRSHDNTSYEKDRKISRLNSVWGNNSTCNDTNSGKAVLVTKILVTEKY